MFYQKISLESCQTFDKEERELSTGLGYVFEALQDQRQLYLYLADAYIKADTPYKINAGQILERLNLVAQPVVKLPTAESFGLTEAKEERLSQIIAEINSRTGKAYDNDVAVKAMLQIRDILLKSDKLKTSARNNTVKDFEFSYFDDIDDALIEGLEQNQDFFSLLLSNDEIKRQVLGIFIDEIYKSLREA